MSRNHVSALTSEDVAFGPPANILPSSLSLSPSNNDLMLLFPDPSTGKRQLYHYDSDLRQFQLFVNIDTNGELSHEEKLRRERMRLFTQGITSYSWGKRSPNESARLLIPMNGQIIVFDPKYNEVVTVYDGKLGAGIDPSWSPNGKSVAFVIGRDLYYIPLPDEIVSASQFSLIRLTTAGSQEGISCGLADFLAQEEMDRYRGYWWSSDSTKIIYEVLDETIVPEFRIPYLDSNDPYQSESHRYPFAGGPNPFTALSIVDITIHPHHSSEGFMKSTGISLPKLLSLPYLNLAGDTSTSVPIEALFEKYLQCEDNYIARVDPTPNSNFFIQIQNRLQTTLHVIYLESFPPFNWYPVLQETSNTWINLHHLLTFLPMDWNGLEKQNDSLYFVWGSERTGYMQLYLYEFDLQSHTANILNPIGEHGDWVVDSILSVDDKNSLVYYMGNREHPTEKHVYVSPLVSSHKGPNIARLTHESGWYQDVVVDTDKHILYGNYSNLNTPPVLFCSKFPDLIHQLTNLPLQAPEYTVLFRNYTSSDPSALSQSSPSGLLISPLSMLRTEVLMNKLRIPELHTIEHIHDGQKIQLHCHALLPDPNLYGPGPYPCIVAVYGGPHVQRVTNGWSGTGEMRAQRLVNAGYVVLRCDNRGSSRRGLAFEGAIKHDMGHLEIVDQEAAVEYFVRKGLVDPARVGIYGWSYGGYMVAMSLCKSNSFCCGISGAPVTSWDGYDSHYTERYMGRPIDNPGGYTTSNVMNYVHHLTGKLLLIHGGIDENVHFRHTSRFISSLISARKRYDFMFFPSERHCPHDVNGWIVMEDRIMDFIKDNC